MKEALRLQGSWDHVTPKWAWHKLPTHINFSAYRLVKRPYDVSEILYSTVCLGRSTAMESITSEGGELSSAADIQEKIGQLPVRIWPTLSW